MRAPLGTGQPKFLEGVEARVNKTRRAIDIARGFRSCAALSVPDRPARKPYCARAVIFRSWFEPSLMVEHALPTMVTVGTLPGEE